MKKLITLLSLFCISQLTAFATTGPDEIVGIWVSSSGKGHIQIYKEGANYSGKLVWLKEPNNASGQLKTDANNPDVKLRSKTILGLQILRNFQFDKTEWNNGKIYDPENGKEYKCFLKLKDASTLNVRGYIGIAMLGRTEVWTRLK